MFKTTLEPQMFALVQYQEDLLVAPAITIGGSHMVFTDNKMVNTLSFMHRDNALRFYKTLDGSLRHYNEFREMDNTQMFYSMVSEVLISPSYRIQNLGSDKVQFPLKQYFIDFLVYMCHEIKKQNVTDFFLFHELQKNISDCLIQADMQVFMYDCATIAYAAVAQYEQQLQIEKQQAINEPTDEDLKALW